MTFGIFDKYNLINGVSDSSLGPINPLTQIDAAKRVMKFLKSLGWNKINEKNIIFADQIHQDGIYICKKEDSGLIKFGVDALITNHVGQILAVKTADCLPILIYEPMKRVVAAIHAGRKSLTMEIISKTILKMMQAFDIKPKELRVAIGPHIRKCHYFLRSGHINDLLKTKWQRYFEERNDKVYFDMTKAALNELIGFGVLKENIEDSGICTFEDYQRYYSARKKETDPKIYKYKEKLPCFVSIIGMSRKE